MRNPRRFVTTGRRVRGRKLPSARLPGSTGAGVLLVLLSLVVTSCGGGGEGPVVPPEVDTGTLSGAVRQAIGQAPIAGATVKVGNVSVATSASGQFEVQNVPLGPVLVEVTAPHFDSHSQTVTVQKGSNLLDVLLAPQSVYEYGDFTAYVDPAISVFRGAIFVIAGATGDSRFLARGKPPEVCREWCGTWLELRQELLKLGKTYGLALFGMVTGTNDDARYNHMIEAVAALASQSGHGELASAPLLLVGHSLGGCIAYGFTRLHASRVIGFMSGKGGCHSPTGAGVLGALAVPAFFFIGESDEPSRIANITAVFEQNRAEGAPWAVAVEPGAGHATPNSIGLQIRWMDAVLARRLPPAGSFTLVAVAETSGWLGNRTTFAIADYASYPDDKSVASWLPSQDNAQDWQGFVTPGDTE